MIRARADPKLPDKMGQTPVHYSARSGTHSILDAIAVLALEERRKAREAAENPLGCIFKSDDEMAWLKPSDFVALLDTALRIQEMKGFEILEREGTAPGLLRRTWGRCGGRFAEI